LKEAENDRYTLKETNSNKKRQTDRQTTKKKGQKRKKDRQ
jgi:hypothetical protein